MSDYCIDGYKRLAAAVVEQAIKDYTKALRRLSRHPRDREATDAKQECERFFQRDIGTYSDLDGEYIMRKIKEKVDAEMRR